MNRMRWRLLVACLASSALRSRSPGVAPGESVRWPTFEAIPAPGSVTYEKTIAYCATLENDNKANFTHVVFRQFRPVARFGGQTYPATIVKKSCAAALDAKGRRGPDERRDRL